MAEAQSMELVPDLEAITAVADVSKQYLANLKGPDGRPVFAEAGLSYQELVRQAKGKPGYREIEDLVIDESLGIVNAATVDVIRYPDREGERHEEHGETPVLQVNQRLRKRLLKVYLSFLTIS